MSLRNIWWKLACIAMFGTGVTYAEQTEIQFEVSDRLVAAAEELDAIVAESMAANASKYWIGLLCVDVNEALRDQLGLENGVGLLVDAVTDDAPAKKAGVQRHDVVISVQPTNRSEPDAVKKLSNVADLVTAVQAAETTPLRLTLVRHGERKQIEVIPAERPKPMATVIDTEEPKDRLFFSTFNPVVNTDFQMFIAGPMFASNAKSPALPEGVTMEFRQVVGEPEKIFVTKGEQKWETTETELAKLPEEIRVLVVEQLAARRSTPATISVPTFTAMPAVPAAPVAPFVTKLDPVKVATRPLNVATKIGLQVATVATLPDDVTVTITRKGSEPAKLSVKKNDQSWDIADTELDKLPEDLQKVVAPMIVRKLPKPPHVTATVQGPEAVMAQKKKAAAALEAATKAEAEQLHGLQQALQARQKVQHDEEILRAVKVREQHVIVEKLRKEMMEQRELLKREASLQKQQAEATSLEAESLRKQVESMKEQVEMRKLIKDLDAKIEKLQQAVEKVSPK